MYFNLQFFRFDFTYLPFLGKFVQYELQFKVRYDTI